MDNIKSFEQSFRVKGEWHFEYEDGTREGPFFNSFPPEGLGWVGERMQSGASPYLVVGDDAVDGYEISEAFRKPVSTIIRSGAQVRFRTQLLPSECNGDHTKACIYVEGADSPGTGIMLNMLARPWSKAINTTLTVECRVTVQGVS